MTTNEVAGFDLPIIGGLGATDFLGISAARVEMAPVWRTSRVGDIAA